MVLGKFSVPRRVWIIVGQGPPALAVGAGRFFFFFLVFVLLFFLVCLLTFLSFGRRPDID